MKKGRVLVCGDVHGSHKALLQVLERSGFDNDSDKIIFLGDLVDGWGQSMEVIKEIQRIDNKVVIMGNHDDWMYGFLRYGIAPTQWVNQGGDATLKSFLKGVEGSENQEAFKDDLISFFDDTVYYHVENERLFVHGGINWHLDVDKQMVTNLMWDRHLWSTAQMWEGYTPKPVVKAYNEVFVGHTSTCYNHSGQLIGIEPQHASNVWNLDQGCGWEGVLTLMCVETKQFWQSDYSKDLYPNEKGR